MSAGFIILSVICLYMLGMLFIGWWAGGKIKNLSDFFVAGRRIGYLFSVAAMFSLWFGACSSMGTAGTVYKQGLRGIISDPFGASLALIIAGLFYVVLFRRNKFFTVVDVFGKSYSKGTEIFAALLMIPVYIGWLGSQIVAIGFVFEALTKYDANIGMIIGTLVVLFYTYAGGMWAVTVTDFFQATILVVGIVAIVPNVLGQVGGLSGLIAQTPKDFFNIMPPVSTYPEWASWIGKWLIMGLGCIVGQDLVQRSLSSRTEGIARSSTISAGILYLLMGFVIIAIGLAGRIIIPNVANPEYILPALALKYFHPLLMGLFISALLSAIMSSADGSLIAAVSLTINNIIRKIYPHLSEKHLLGLSKIITIVCMGLAMFIALYVKQVYNLMINSWSTLLVSIFVPVSVALFWKKLATVEACWGSMLCGFGTWIFYIIWKLGGLDINDANMYIYYIASLYGFLASIGSYALITVFRKPLRKMIGKFGQ